MGRNEKAYFCVLLSVEAPELCVPALLLHLLPAVGP